MRTIEWVWRLVCTLVRLDILLSEGSTLGRRELGYRRQRQVVRLVLQRSCIKEHT